MTISRLLADRRLAVAASLVLGGVFIYSSWHKIADPPDFAKILLNYKLLPASAINATAIIMPWLEALAGLALVTGLLRRGGALGIGLMTLAFIAALGFNLYRGHPTICGCFSTFEASKHLTDAEKFFKMKREMVMDVGLLLLALHVLFRTTPGKALTAAAVHPGGASRPPGP